ncbi:hypothetical protein N8075_04510 [Planktomarina temperata]|nr:hypothetical protein [Planktomarina temperata]
MREVLVLGFVALGLLAGCSNTLESTEVAQQGGKRYVITVSEYDNGLYRNADILINDQIALKIAPKSFRDPACSQIKDNGYIITCVYTSTFQGQKLEVRKITKSSLLALSVNYEIFLSDNLLEVVNIRNR